MQQIIGKNLSRVNTSTNNPVDLGMFGFDPAIFVHTAVEGAKDPNIDLVVLCQYPEMVRAIAKEFWEYIEKIIVDGLKQLGKPTVMVIPRLVLHNPDLETIRTEFTKSSPRSTSPRSPTQSAPHARPIRSTNTSIS